MNLPQLLRGNAVAVALALTAAACGGGSEAADTTTTPPTPPPTVEDTEDALTEAAPAETETETEEPRLEPAPTEASETETEASPAPAEPPAGGSAIEGLEGVLGDTIAFTAEGRGSLEYTVTEIVDPATDTVAANNYRIPEGQRYVFVRSTFTWVDGDYESAAIFPGLNVSLVDDRGNTFPKVIAAVDECEPFPDRNVEVGETVEGCQIYEISETTPITAVQYSPTGFADEVLTWRVE